MATETGRKTGEVTVAVVLPEDQLPRAEAVNFFAISHVGTEVQIVPAYVDAHQAATLLDRIQKGEEAAPKLVAQALHRLVVSVATLEQLKRRVDEILVTLKGTQDQPDEGAHA